MVSAVEEMDADLACHIVTAHRFVAVRISVRAARYVFAAYANDHGAAIPAPGASVRFKELGAVVLGSGLHIGVVVAAHANHIILYTGFVIDDQALTPSGPARVDIRKPVAHIAYDRLAALYDFGRRLFNRHDRLANGFIAKQYVGRLPAHRSVLRELVFLLKALTPFGAPK